MENEKKVYSYFMDKIFPPIVLGLISGVWILVTSYFTLAALDTRVTALEASAVRKDVQSETDKRIEQKIDGVDKKMDALLTHFSIRVIDPTTDPTKE